MPCFPAPGSRSEPGPAAPPCLPAVMSALPLLPPLDADAPRRQAAPQANTARPLRLLLSVPEPHPTHRPDVTVLFGHCLPRLGVASDLVGCHAAGPAPPWAGGQALTQPAPARGLGRHLGSLRADLTLLRRARQGYDAVVVRDKTVGAWLGLLAARWAGVPFIYWMSFPMVEAWAQYAHERGRSAGWLRWAAALVRGHLLSRLLYGSILPRAAQVFVQSDAMRDALVARGLPAERLTAVPMGVDAEADAFRRPVVPPTRLDAPVFGYLGTLNRVRQPELMVQAFALLHRDCPTARLLLVGDCDNAADRAWLARCIEAAGPAASAIELTGWLPPDEGWRRIAACVAGLSPIPRGAIFDVGSPTKVVEYFALGLPVLANDQPDQARAMAAAGGHCVPLTPEGLAAGMRDVLARPAEHRAVAARGRDWVRRHRSYAALAAGVAGTLRAVVPAAAPAAGTTTRAGGVAGPAVAIRAPVPPTATPAPAPPSAAPVLMIGPGLGCRGGISSVCASYRDGGLFQRLGVRYLSTFEQGSALRKLVVAASALARFTGLLLARRVGVVHVHVATNASFWRKSVFCAAARLARVPCLLHLHSGDMPAFWQRCGSIGRRWIMHTLRGARRVIVLSPEWQAWLRTLDPALPIEVLPNPVPPGPAAPPTDAGEGRSPEPSVLFLGRLQPAKGVPELLRAFVQVRQVLPSARLVLGGEGDLAAVRSQAQALGLQDALDCPGWVDGPAKHALLRRSWAFALPSHHEGVPIGMLEALAAGVPAVGTPVGGVPGLLVASGGGLLVRVGDASALAEALLALLTDPARARRLGDQGRQYVQSHHGLDAVERRLAALYAQVTGARAGQAERLRA
jgi:glycosyltransferase involved in cell wall biosynthesis